MLVVGFKYKACWDLLHIWQVCHSHKKQRKNPCARRSGAAAAKNGEIRSAHIIVPIALEGEE